MCKWSTRSVLVGKTETVPGVRKHTLKQSSDMKQVSVIKCEVIVMGKFPFYRNLGVSLQGGDTLAVIWCQRRAWSRRDQHTQWPWKWARTQISVALGLALKPCEDTEQFILRDWDIIERFLPTEQWAWGKGLDTLLLLCMEPVGSSRSAVLLVPEVVKGQALAMGVAAWPRWAGSVQVFRGWEVHCCNT